jgi:hypothetical protein
MHKMQQPYWQSANLKAKSMRIRAENLVRIPRHLLC